MQIGRRASPLFFSQIGNFGRAERYRILLVLDSLINSGGARVANEMRACHQLPPWRR